MATLTTVEQAAHVAAAAYLMKSNPASPTEQPLQSTELQRGLRGWRVSVLARTGKFAGVPRIHHQHAMRAMEADTTPESI